MRNIRIAMLGFACVAFAMPAFAQRDNYMCYKAKSSGAFTGETVYLDDILTGGNPQELDELSGLPGVAGGYAASKVKDFCVPTDVEGAGIADGATGYLSFAAKRAGDGVCAVDNGMACDADADCPMGVCTITDAFDKKSAEALSILVGDGVVNLPVDFGKELTVMVPSSYDTGVFLPPPADKETYKCYSVKATKASCVGGTNAGEACKDSTTCSGGGVCTPNAKFPKETNPSGLSVSIEDSIGDNADPMHPERTLALSKLKTFCQAASFKRAGSAAEPSNDEHAGLLCYGGKPAKAACEGGSNDGAVCGEDADCPAGICRPEPKSTGALGLKVANQFGNFTVDAAKDNVVCVQACRNYEAEDYTDYMAHVTNLALGAVGVGPLAGLARGMDVDGNPATAAPFGETDGIDNQLQGLSGFLNTLLQEQLDEGGFSLLFQANQFQDGPVTITGFTADLHSEPGCAGAGDPNNPPLDPGNASDPCTYDMTGIGTTCVAADSQISLAVNVVGSATPPTATAIGGGPGNNFTIDVGFGGAQFAITAQNVLVDAIITHDGTDLEEIKGVLGGGVDKQALIDAVGDLPNQCIGGTNEGAECVNNTPCTGGGNCQLADGIPFTAAGLSSFIDVAFPGDLNLTAGTNDPSDPNNPNESVSIGLGFRATAANFR